MCHALGDLDDTAGFIATSLMFCAHRRTAVVSSRAETCASRGVWEASGFSKQRFQAVLIRSGLLTMALIRSSCCKTKPERRSAARTERMVVYVIAESKN